MIDSHAHVSFKQFDNDREEVIKRAREAGVTGWIEVGTDLAQSQKAIRLAGKIDLVWAAAGVHPSDVAEVFGMDPSVPLAGEAWDEFVELVKKQRVVAIGEVGLDFYRGGTPRTQMPVLKNFIALGAERDMPLIFHLRSGGGQDAYEILLDYVEQLPRRERPRGVMHTFSGNMKQAKRFLNLGFYLGFSGVVTFKNAGATAEIAKLAPLDRILIETDCPFLAPEPHRGERNEPAYLKLVAEKIAEAKRLSLEEVDRVTEDNTRSVFRLKP